VESQSQPLFVAGFKRPGQDDADDPVYEVISLILSGGRTSLLYKELVQEKKIAVEVEASATYPSSRYPNLFVIFVAPAVGHTVEENQKALEDLLAGFAARKIDAETLQRVKTQARASVIRRLDSNSGLASLLTSYYGSYGDWRKLFTQLDDLNKVTAEDVERVARLFRRQEPHGGLHRGAKCAQPRRGGPAMSKSRPDIVRTPLATWLSP
jgi:predicted Zn-dependent peptidase